MNMDSRQHFTAVITSSVHPLPPTIYLLCETGCVQEQLFLSVSSAVFTKRVVPHLFLGLTNLICWPTSAINPILAKTKKYYKILAFQLFLFFLINVFTLLHTFLLGTMRKVSKLKLDEFPLYAFKQQNDVIKTIEVCFFFDALPHPQSARTE